jgi:hypothetical protein
MSSIDALATRIRAEYREMPGLNLSFKQACRLWQVQPADCERVLDALLREGFLGQTLAGNFVALPTLRTAGVPLNVTSLVRTRGTERRRTA